MTELEAELVTAVARCRALLATASPITATVTHEYLGAVLLWAAEHVRARNESDTASAPSGDWLLDWIPLSDLACIVRALGWPSPSPEQEDRVARDERRTLGEVRREGATAEAQAVLDEYLSGR